MTRVSPSATLSPSATTTFQTFATISARISFATAALLSRVGGRRLAGRRHPTTAAQARIRPTMPVS